MFQKPIDHFGTEHFSKSHFGMDVSSREHFGTCTIRRCRRSGRWTFQHGTFRHGDFSAWGLFGTRNFRHRKISAQGHFGTWTSLHKCRNVCAKTSILLCKVPKYPCAETFRCRNVQVPKYPCAEMFRCRKFFMPKIPRAENTPCRNVPVLKSPSAGTSAAPNGSCAEMFPWWNIHAKMTLAEMFQAEMVYRLSKV